MEYNVLLSWEEIHDNLCVYKTLRIKRNPLKSIMKNSEERVTEVFKKNRTS